MTLAPLALLLVLGAEFAPSPSTVTNAGLGPFQLGMSRADAMRVAPCRLRRPTGRSVSTDLACADYRLLTETMQLRLSFSDDKLTAIQLFHHGFLERYAKQKLDAVLQTLTAQFGELAGPQAMPPPLTAQSVLDGLKRETTYRSSASVIVSPRQPDRGLLVQASAQLSRGPAQRSELSAEYGGIGPLTGFGFDVYSHSVSLRIKSQEATVATTTRHP